ncbi:hypothetical protein [Cohnella herbarum]|uniref:Hemerythrin-like domain-containing protein n=1 Tax=Cohnella herbarum TaxID=2728023 RepID=A0A7Z2VHC5_9BACL|nr:hypothetical protein [Cohnella herbarum]QJD83079.1 hypothetical protein HH215_07770 [Cohnella herbarum]
MTKLHVPHDKHPLNAESSEYGLETSMLRAKQEHELLRFELHNIFEQACSLRQGKDDIGVNRDICKLSENVKIFMQDWNEHTSWEETELFPNAVRLLGAESDLYSLMGREYDLAERSIQAFMQSFDRTSLPLQRDEARRLAGYLIQAYAIMSNRFREEEEIMQELEEDIR